MSDRPISVYDLYKRRERFKTLSDLRSRVDEFFSLCAKLRVPVTYTGLMLVLGLNHKSELSALRHHEEFGADIRQAIGAVEFFYESQLASPKPFGAIFALKNFGWSDRAEVAVTEVDPQKVLMKEAQLAILNQARKARAANILEADASGGVLDALDDE